MSVFHRGEAVLDVFIKPCVGSGLCCLKARCFLGVRAHGPGNECPSLIWSESERRYWCGEILKAEEPERENRKQGLYIGEGCCMPLFNSLREERFKNMTEAQREAYRAGLVPLGPAPLVQISLSRSSDTSSEE